MLQAATWQLVAAPTKWEFGIHLLAQFGIGFLFRVLYLFRAFFDHHVGAQFQFASFVIR